jgi:hypothetical protein
MVLRPRAKVGLNLRGGETERRAEWRAHAMNPLAASEAILTTCSAVLHEPQNVNTLNEGTNTTNSTEQKVTFEASLTPRELRSTCHMRVPRWLIIFLKQRNDTSNARIGPHITRCRMHTPYSVKTEKARKCRWS